MFEIEKRLIFSSGTIITPLQTQTVHSLCAFLLPPMSRAHRCASEVVVHFSLLSDPSSGFICFVPSLFPTSGVSSPNYPNRRDWLVTYIEYVTWLSKRKLCRVYLHRAVVAHTRVFREKAREQLRAWQVMGRRKDDTLKAVQSGERPSLTEEVTEECMWRNRHLDWRRKGLEELCLWELTVEITSWDQETKGGL